MCFCLFKCYYVKLLMFFFFDPLSCKIGTGKQNQLLKKKVSFDPAFPSGKMKFPH